MQVRFSQPSPTFRTVPGSQIHKRHDLLSRQIPACRTSQAYLYLKQSRQSSDLAALLSSYTVLSVCGLVYLEAGASPMTGLSPVSGIGILLLREESLGAPDVSVLSPAKYMDTSSDAARFG